MTDGNMPGFLLEGLNANKSDKVLAMEARELLEAYTEKANEALGRGLIIAFQLANGSDGNPCKIVGFNVIKRIMSDPVEQPK